MRTSILPAIALMLAASPAVAGEAHKEAFGKLADGTPVEAVLLSNTHGMKVRVLAWGAALQELVVPGRKGATDVILGYDDMTGYLKASNYFGATVGRYANRIAKGRFTLDGKVYELATNDGPNALHGGARGFDKHLWTIDRVASGAKSASAMLTYTSPDGEEGYPGTMKVTATFTLTETNELEVTYRATSDKPTIANITNHSYFNLGGVAAGHSATEALVTIPAAHYTPVDTTLIPTGEIRSVEGTPFDFRKPRRVSERIRDGRDEQLRIGRGYDHNWVVSRAPVSGLQLMAKVEDPVSGRTMQIFSNQPGVQFYTGNFLDGTATGKGGVIYRQGDGLCFEPQVFPDTPNKPSFGSARLDPGQTYENRIVYRFSVARAAS
jgi:aldose 1-epimerase